MSAFNLRGISSEVMNALKNEAKKHHSSVNALILKLVEQGLGYSKRTRRPIYHDLDDLAGTWNATDLKNFEKNTKKFEEIDEDLWL